MIRIVNTRLVVEKPTTHEKYYPTVITATTQQDYPFAVSGATIDVVSNLPPNTSGYAAPINFNDIVRLQVSVKNHYTEHTVWEDIFHGRVESMSSEFGNGNQLKLYCVGHEAELRTDLIEETYTYPANSDAKSIISRLSKYFTANLHYSASNVAAGVIFPTYDTTADQTYLDTVIGDMEKQSGYDHIFSVVPVYTTGQNLSYVYTKWQPFTTTVTPAYKIIEGTHRLIAADFDVSGENVVTMVKVYGDTPDTSSVTGTTAPKAFTGTVSGSTCSGTIGSTTVTGTTAAPVQYKGSYTDSALEAQIGKRTSVETYSWIKSNALCVSIAEGLQKGARVPVVAGQVTLIGTPAAKVGDLVYVKIPSIELNRASITGNYYVYRVQHNISKSGFQTTLDLGRVKKVAEDYVAQVSKSVKVVKCSLVKR